MVLVAQGREGDDLQPLPFSLQREKGGGKGVANKSWQEERQARGSVPIALTLPPSLSLAFYLC